MITIGSLSPGQRFRLFDKTGTVVKQGPGSTKVKIDRPDKQVVITGCFGESRKFTAKQSKTELWSRNAEVEVLTK